jgi:para-nitrobenzyl esterase
MMTATGRQVLISALGTLAMGSAALAADTGTDVAQTRSGPVQAVSRGTMQSYFAIPYAAPPVGDLRWRAPQPAIPWTAPLANPKSGLACIQTAGSVFRATAESEDCLRLDIHRPVGKGPFPVMVWIHGGAFVTGSASVYSDPTPLVSRGVIVVAINYRLGALGFLAHPALRDADGSSGDYGIMDQQAALRWVRDNIAAFGGDPKNVTIFGESAGGFSVMSHLASPGSAGLFHKAIIESGAYGVSAQMTQAELEARSRDALDHVLAEAGPDAPAACRDGVQTAACLRALPLTIVQGRLMKAFNGAVPNIVPSIDGKVLPRSVKSTFAAGANNKVAVINGSNENENLLFLALNELGQRLSAKPPVLDSANRSFLLTTEAYAKAAETLSAESGVPVAELTGRAYPLSAYGADIALQPSLAAAAAGTDSTFSCNGANVSARIAAQGSPVWMYEFRDQTSPPLVGRFGGKYVLSLPQGAAHASELPYVFNMIDLGSPDRQALKDTVTGYWASFARSGDPNGDGRPAWPKYQSAHIQALDVPARGGVAPMAASAFRTEHKCDTVWARQRF